MGLIAELRSLLGTAPRERKPDGSAVDAEFAAVDDALGRLRAEREVARATAESARERRHRALMSEDYDAVAAIEREADRAHLRLEQLECVEGELLERRGKLQSDMRRQRWELLRGRYFGAVDAYIAALREAEQRLGPLQELWHEADAEGFAVERLHTFVTPPLLVDRARIESFCVQVESARDASSNTTRGVGDADVFPVRLTVPVGALMAGEVGGFASGEAWRLVRRGLGEWADARRVPPEPAPDPRRAVVPEPAEDGTLPVRFLSHLTVGPNDAPGFRPGDVAVFPAPIAEQLVRAGNAEFIDEGAAL